MIIPTINKESTVLFINFISILKSIFKLIKSH